MPSRVGARRKQVKQMTAGRKSAPAALKIVEGRGNGRDSGGRVVPHPPKFKRIPPEKPEYIAENEYASRLWDLVTRDLTSLNLLKEMDGTALEMGCETYARWRAAVDKRRKHGIITQSAHQGRDGVTAWVAAPWVGIEERASKDFRSWCSEFGLTPAAEMKLAKEAAGETGDDNPFE